MHAKGLLGLLNYQVKEKGNANKCNYDVCNHRNAYPEAHSAPAIRLLRLKKGGKDCFSSLSPYGFFLRVMKSTAPTAKIAISRAIDTGMKYWSAIDAAGVACGVGVACTGSTTNAASACDP